MKRTVLYNFTSDDPPFTKLIDEARNRVQELCWELREDTPEHKAFNKVATGNQFTLPDVTFLRKYSQRVLVRIRDKWNDGSELAQSIIQAGEHFVTIMSEVEKYSLYEGKP